MLKDGKKEGEREDGIDGGIDGWVLSLPSFSPIAAIDKSVVGHTEDSCLGHRNTFDWVF